MDINKICRKFKVQMPVCYCMFELRFLYVFCEVYGMKARERIRAHFQKNQKEQNIYQAALNVSYAYFVRPRCYF